MRALVLVILVAFAAPVAAQPSADDKAEAKAAFQRAEAAERRKDWRTAIDEYQHAYDRVPHPDVLFNIAVNLERLEEYRDAATFYRRYLDDKDDAADRARVEALVDKLRARPGLVTITSEPPGAEVSIDGKRAGVTPLEVRLSGRRAIDVGDTRRTITVEFGEPQTVAVRGGARAGTLIVNGNVAGAQVFVDDQLVGVIPLQVPIEAGSHRVLVSAEGWATYERPVEIHPEGSTQVTANLVRPLGYVEPEPAKEAPRGFVSFAGGYDVDGESGGLYAITFGGHKGPIDYSLGYGFGGSGAAFVLEVRVGWPKGTVRPYLRGSTWLGSLTTVTGHAGVLLAIDVGTRARTSVFVDVGGGVARTTADAPGERRTIIPVTGGLLLSY